MKYLKLTTEVLFSATLEEGKDYVYVNPDTNAVSYSRLLGGGGGGETIPANLMMTIEFAIANETFKLYDRNKTWTLELTTDENGKVDITSDMLTSAGFACVDRFFYASETCSNGKSTKNNIQAVNFYNFNPKDWNLTKLDFFFDSCNGSGTLDLSNWDTSGVTSMKGMFKNQHASKIILGEGWTMANVTVTSSMFNNDSYLSEIDATAISSDEVELLKTAYKSTIALSTQSLIIYVSGGYWATANGGSSWGWNPD